MAYAGPSTSVPPPHPVSVHLPRATPITAHLFSAIPCRLSSPPRPPAFLIALTGLVPDHPRLARSLNYPPGPCAPSCLPYHSRQASKARLAMACLKLPLIRLPADEPMRALLSTTAQPRGAAGQLPQGNGLGLLSPFHLHFRWMYTKSFTHNVVPPDIVKILLLQDCSNDQLRVSSAQATRVCQWYARLVRSPPPSPPILSLPACRCVFWFGVVSMPLSLFSIAAPPLPFWDLVL